MTKPHGRARIPFFDLVKPCQAPQIRYAQIGTLTLTERNLFILPNEHMDVLFTKYIPDT